MKPDWVWAVLRERIWKTFLVWKVCAAIHFSASFDSIVSEILTTTPSWGWKHRDLQSLARLSFLMSQPLVKCHHISAPVMKREQIGQLTENEGLCGCKGDELGMFEGLFKSESFLSGSRWWLLSWSIRPLSLRSFSSDANLLWVLVLEKLFFSV